ncbi:MAG TPA: amidase domain-containing protein [Pseudonocardiaceae bacterium]|nr:amidase domain-containing protein [Pseudonocardiaceae bacterium]
MTYHIDAGDVAVSIPPLRRLVRVTEEGAAQYPPASVFPNFRDEFLVPLTLAVSDLAVLLLILSWRTSWLWHPHNAVAPRVGLVTSCWPQGESAGGAMTMRVSQLAGAQPQLWRVAANAWQQVHTLTQQTSDDIRDRGAGKVDQHWTDAVGQKASATLTSAATGFDIASDTMAGVVMILDGLADGAGMAQATLHEALTEAAGLGLTVADDGRVTVTESGLPGAAGDAQLPRVQSLVSEALNAATQLDHDAAAELRNLAAAVTATDFAQVENQIQGAASQDELAILADTIPANATPGQVSAWWNLLSPQQQTELENAIPLQIYNLGGIPQSVKDQLRGSGDINRMALVQFATDHWDDTSLDWSGLDNCTNFASTALSAAGMRQTDSWHAPELDGPLVTSLFPSVAAGTATHSWGGAQNLHDLLIDGGGTVVSPSQAKPGDVLFFQWDPGDGNPAGHVHHTAIVTAVLPNGDIRYTQHTDPGLDNSLDGRYQDIAAGEGASQPVIVAPSPNGY